GDTGISQVAGPSSSNMPWSNTPPGTSLSCAVAQSDVSAFEKGKPLGTRDGGLLRSCIPTACPLACLRIAGSVAVAVARLATHLPGCGFGRAGFAPAGQQTVFQGSASSFPDGPAFPGRTPSSSPVFRIQVDRAVG